MGVHGRSRPAEPRHGLEHPVEGSGHVMLVVFPDDRLGHAAVVAHVAGGDARAEHPSDRRMPQRVCGLTSGSLADARMLSNALVTRNTGLPCHSITELVEMLRR